MQQIITRISHKIINTEIKFKMMKKALKNILACAAIAICTFSSVRGQEIQLKGHVKGLGNSKVTFYYITGTSQKSDIVTSVDGKFMWKAAIVSPQKITVMFPKRSIQLFAESGHMTVNGTMDSLDNLSISGSKLQTQFSAYSKAMNEAVAKDTTGSSLVIPNTRNENFARNKIFRAKKRVFDDQFIQKNSENILSVFLLQDRAILGSYEEVMSGYEKLGSSVKATAEGISLTERLEILKRRRVGEQVYNFTLNDLDGKPVNINAFKGQYVLIDFWASWCGPCRAENPNLVKAYNKYKANKFNVIGVTIDEDLDKWKQAVKEDGTPWTQLTDLKDRSKAVATYYGILGVPSSLLIDPDGKIIAMDVRGESLQKKLAEMFQASPNKS